MSYAHTTIGALNRAPLFFFCDHATNRIPPEFENLGLDRRFMETHIAYDIGARDLTARLAARFETRAVFSDFSRLLVDPNRSIDREDHIPEVSDNIAVPGNKGLSGAEREARIARFFEPYHQALSTEIDQVCARFDDPVLVSIHSFTPQLHVEREQRPWDIGVLWAWDEPSARAFIKTLMGADPALVIGDNEPYDARGFNYTVDRHIRPLGVRHVTLEVRQDLLLGHDKIERMARLLESAFRDLISTPA